MTPSVGVKGGRWKCRSHRQKSRKRTRPRATEHDGMRVMGAIVDREPGGVLEVLFELHRCQPSVWRGRTKPKPNIESLGLR